MAPKKLRENKKTCMTLDELQQINQPSHQTLDICEPRKLPTLQVKEELDKMTIATYLSVVILYLNGLNAPNKRHRVGEWIRKQDPDICYLQKTHFRDKTHRD